MMHLCSLSQSPISLAVLTLVFIALQNRYPFLRPSNGPIKIRHDTYPCNYKKPVRFAQAGIVLPLTGHLCFGDPVGIRAWFAGGSPAPSRAHVLSPSVCPGWEGKKSTGFPMLSRMETIFWATILCYYFKTF